MANFSELRFILSNQYSILVGALETERVAYPETYSGALHIAEKIRQAILDTGVFAELRPLPTLEPTTVPKK